jgi:hypothetical protein
LRRKAKPRTVTRTTTVAPGRPGKTSGSGSTLAPMTIPPDGVVIDCSAGSIRDNSFLVSSSPDDEIHRSTT